MNRTRISIMAFWVAITTLVGCSSSSEPMQFYLLSPDGAHLKNPDPTQPVVRLTDLHLADYLYQRNLAVRSGAHALHYSPNEAWATPLQQSIPQALQQALAAQSGIRLITTITLESPPKLLELNLTITEFVPSTEGAVILRGFYSLGGEHIKLASHTFDFVEPLHEDGFAPAVATMHTLLVRLASHIGQHVSNG